MVAELNDSDLQEIFALFSSPTTEEVAKLYSKESATYFESEDLGETYELAEEKREFAIDAWRSVLYFLHRHGYTLTKEAESVDLLTSCGIRD